MTTIPRLRNALTTSSTSNPGSSTPRITLSKSINNAIFVPCRPCVVSKLCFLVRLTPHGKESEGKLKRAPDRSHTSTCVRHTANADTDEDSKACMAQDV